MSMVVRPAPDLGIEQMDQSFLLHRAVHSDDLSDAFQERSHVLGRRLDEKLSVVLAYILPEKIEAL